MRHFKQLTLLTLTSLCLMACQPKSAHESDSAASNATSSAQQDQLKLKASIEDIPLTLPECKGNNCPEFSVSRLSSNAEFIDQAIDQAILTHVSSMLDLSPVQPTAAQNAAASAASEVQITPAQKLQAALQPYIQGFLELDQEIKSLGSAHQISFMLKPAVVDNQGPLVTIVLNSSSYLGGAHGSAAQHYYHFDLNNKIPLKLNDLLLAEQHEALKQKAYEAYKAWVKEHELTTNLQEYEQSWPFSLSENFYLAPQGLILQYGEYDIGPYVVGLPRLVIPYNQLNGIVKPKYLALAKAPS